MQLELRNVLRKAKTKMVRGYTPEIRQNFSLVNVATIWITIVVA